MKNLADKQKLDKTALLQTLKDKQRQRIKVKRVKSDSSPLNDDGLTIPDFKKVLLSE